MRASESILRDIIQNQLGLDAKRIYLTNENYNLPNDNNLLVAIDNGPKKPYGNNTSEEYAVDSVTRVNTVYFQEKYNINLLRNGSSMAAIQVISALKSYFANQIQEEYQFKLANITEPIQNISSVEGPGSIGRYLVRVTLLRAYSFEEGVPFYENFEFEYDSEE